MAIVAARSRSPFSSSERTRASSAVHRSGVLDSSAKAHPPKEATVTQPAHAVARSLRANAVRWRLIPVALQRLPRIAGISAGWMVLGAWPQPSARCVGPRKGSLSPEGIGVRKAGSLLREGSATARDRGGAPRERVLRRLS